MPALTVKKVELPEKPGLKTIDAQDLMEMELPKTPDIVPGVFPVGLTVFAGKPKMGKSWLTLAAAVAIASEGYALGKIQVEKGEALYLGLEDNARRLQSRLAVLTEDVPKGLHLATDLPRIDQGGLTFLAEWLDKHRETRYVVIDTLARVRPRRAKNGDIYEEDASVGSQLQTLAMEYRIALVVVHHLRKAFADDPLDAVSGSTGLTGAADAVLVLMRTRGQADAVLHITGRDIEEKSLALRFKPQEGAWLYVGEAKDLDLAPDDRSALQEACEWLESQLQDGPLPAKALFSYASKEGISKITLKRAKEKLQVLSRRMTTDNKGTGNWSWYLKPVEEPSSNIDDTLATVTGTPVNTGTPVTISP